MNRLLQGDVGPAKRWSPPPVPILLLQNGYQTAMMAPTEILAAQHYQTWSKLFAGTGITVGLLTGLHGRGGETCGERAAAKWTAFYRCRNPRTIAGKRTFSRLGLVITDEQHRFGVSQRMALTQKAGTRTCWSCPLRPSPERGFHHLRRFGSFDSG